MNPPSPPTNPIKTRCDNNRCKCCHEMVTCSKFKSKTTGRHYNIRPEITCKIRNLVYLISCKRCGLQYVGETENALHIRMNGHRSDIRTKKTENPVAAHFCQPAHSVKIMWKKKKKPTIPAVPRRSAIQVLSRPDTA